MSDIKRLKFVVDEVGKSFKKKGLLFRLSDGANCLTEFIPTGIPTVDNALCGGIPKARTIEIFGPEASGKTTLALCLCASVQRVGGIAAYVDMEHAIDPDWARKNGVDIDNLLISQPEYGEEALELVNYLVKPTKTDNRRADIIIVDSVASLVPKAELEGSMTDNHVGLQARMMSKHLRKVAGLVSKSGSVVVYINQLRKKIGVFYGNPNTTPGGEAMKFYASVRIEVTRVGYVGEGDNRNGIKSKINVLKSKVATPFKKAFFFIAENGVDAGESVLDVAIEKGVIAKNGSFYVFGSRKVRGKKRLKELFNDDEVFKKKLTRAVKRNKPEKIDVVDKPKKSKRNKK